MDTDTKSTHNSNDTSKSNHEPGEIININKEKGIVLMTNNGQVYIKSGQLEGKKLTHAYTLSEQAKLKVNHILGK